MKTAIQTIMAIPISETIGNAFGANKALGAGAALLTTRFALRSFSGMLVLGAVALGLKYRQRQQAQANAALARKAKKQSRARLSKG